MAKATQILQIEPPTELSFKGPFTDVVTSYLELSNPSDKTVCFKVKTTAPKQYCVRPNSGLIPPKASVKVAVMLQPFEYNAEEKTSKHKFMVQSAFVPEGETSLDNIWKNTPSNELMDTKMRVVFDMPENNLENSAVKLTTPLKQQASSADAELRKAVDDRKRLQNEYNSLELENIQLKERLQRLVDQGGDAQASFASGASMGQRSSESESFKLMHMIVFAIIGILIGIALGKLLI